MSQFAPPPSDLERKIFEAAPLYRRLEFLETDERTFPNKVKLRYQQQMDKALKTDGIRWSIFASVSLLIIIGGGPVAGTLIMLGASVYYGLKLYLLHQRLAAAVRREQRHSPYAAERTYVLEKLDKIWGS